MGQASHLNIVLQSLHNSNHLILSRKKKKHQLPHVHKQECIGANVAEPDALICWLMKKMIFYAIIGNNIVYMHWVKWNIIFIDGKYV